MTEGLPLFNEVYAMKLGKKLHTSQIFTNRLVYNQYEFLIVWREYKFSMRILTESGVKVTPFNLNLN